MIIIKIAVIAFCVFFGLIGVSSFLSLLLAGFFERYSKNHHVEESGFMDFFIEHEGAFLEISLDSAIALMMCSFVCVLLFV